METCNKIPLAQHGRRGKRLKLNTTTLRGAAQAHTDSRITRPTSQAGAAVLQDCLSLKGAVEACSARPCQQKHRQTLLTHVSFVLLRHWRLVSVFL